MAGEPGKYTDLPDGDMPERFNESLPVIPYGVPLPPQARNLHDLPLHNLKFEQFEKLVHRLLMRLTEFNCPKRYGLNGSTQPGFDLYAVRRGRPDRGISAWECKCWKKAFGPATLRKGVERFLERGWQSKVSELIFVVPQAGIKAKLNDAHLEQQAILRKYNVDLDIWGGDELCGYLIGFPEIIETFFTREWAASFCSEYATRKQLEEGRAAESSAVVPGAGPTVVGPNRHSPRRHYSDRYVTWSTGRISFGSFRPRQGAETASCLLQLADAGLSGCLLTLSGRRMLETFAKGFGTEPARGQRAFIVQPPNQYSDQYMLQIGNARIWLNESDTSDLCTVADQWALLLRADYRKLSRAWDCTGFKMLPAEKLVVLGNVSQDAWRVTLEFARAHDYARGETAWHVLDARSSALMVYAPEPRGDLSPGHHLTITGAPAGTRDGITLWWHPPFNDGPISNSGYWGASAAHRWLTQKLVPAAFQWARGAKPDGGLLKRLFRMRSHPSDPLEEMTLTELAWARRLRPSELAKNAKERGLEPLARAIHSSLSDQVWMLPLPADALSLIAEAVLICFEVWRDEYLGYIISKLDLSGGDTVDELRRQISGIDGLNASRSRLEYASRALIDAVANTDGRLGAARVGRILQVLHPLIRHADALEEIECIELR